MQITFQSLASENTLFPALLRDYEGQFARVASFFSYDPAAPATFGNRSAKLRQGSFRSAPRDQVTAALTALNERLGASEAALDKLSRLNRPEALVVVTGQQAGLLTGPAYTIFKALTAIKMAQDLEDRMGVPAIPVFWVATEDHDYEEVRRTFAVDTRGRLRELSLPPEGSQRPVGRIPMPPPRRIRSLMMEFRDIMGPRADETIISDVIHHASSAASFGEWFTRIMVDWLSPLGLVVLDPMEPALRELAKPLYPTAMLRRHLVERELKAAASRLLRRGYAPGLDLEEGHAMFFYEDDGGRRRAMFWRNGELADRDGAMSMTVAEATGRIQRHPQRFSPNVVLRPVIQDYLLPTAAFVVGPGELAYMAQMKEVFPLFGLEMPPLVPRMSLTIIDPEVGGALRRRKVGAEQLWADPENVFRGHMESLDAIGIGRHSDRLRSRVAEAFGEARRDLNGVGPHFSRAGEQLQERALRLVDRFERKARQHHRRNNKDAVNDLELAIAHLRPGPGGALQERTLSGMAFVGRYGRPFFRALMRAPLVPGHQMALVRGEGSPGMLPG